MTGKRPQLYKIRRSVMLGNGCTEFNWLSVDGNEVWWVPNEIDGFAFADYKRAQNMCETFKTGKLRHPRALYHSVVPA